jgi:hypothetical protein
VKPPGLPVVTEGKKSLEPPPTPSAAKRRMSVVPPTPVRHWSRVENMLRILCAIVYAWGAAAG